MSGVRIASLLPSATEICYALGLGDALVGVSHECDFPSAARTKPVLTSSRLDGNLESQAIDDQVRSLVQEGLSIYAVDEVRLAQLQPTLVLTQDTCSVCAVPFVEVERATLRTLGPGARIVSLSPNTIEALFADILKIGGLAGIPGRAETLVTALRARVTRLQARTAPLPRYTVLHLEWLQPPMVAGHWTPSLLVMAGGEPVLGHLGVPTRAESWQTIAAADPDVLLLAPCGYKLDKTLTELGSYHPHLSALRAVQAGRAFVADGNAYFNRPGPRLVDSAEIAAAAIHPAELANAFEFGPETLRRWP